MASPAPGSEYKGYQGFPGMPQPLHMPLRPGHRHAAANNNGSDNNSNDDYPTLSSTNSSAWHKLYVANKAELTKQVSFSAGAKEHLWGGDDWYLRWHETPVSLPSTIHPSGIPPSKDIDTHNLFEHLELPVQQIGSAVQMAVGRFEQQRRCFSWVVGPMDQPQLEIALFNRQLFLEDDQPAMVVDLNEPKTRQAMFEPKWPGRLQTELRSEFSEERVREPLEEQLRLQGQKRNVIRMPTARTVSMESSQDKGKAPETVPNDGPSSLTSTSRTSDRQTTESLWSDAARSRFGVRVSPHENPGLNLVLDRPANIPPPKDSYVPIGNPRQYIMNLQASQVYDWVRAWAHEARDDRDTDILHWTHIYKTLMTSLPSSQFQMYAAMSHDRIVGTGYVHMYQGVAAIHCVVVRPTYRRQGIGSALTAYGLRTAHRKGYNMAMLTATRSGLRMFRSMGFKDIGRVKLYVFRPLRQPARPQLPQKQDSKDKKSELVKQAEEDGWELVD